MAEEFEQVIPCQMCDTEFLTGRLGSHGHYVTAYQLHVCNTCYVCNLQGWAPLYEQKLVKHLEQRGIELPARNPNGLFPRD